MLHAPGSKPSALRPKTSGIGQKTSDFAMFKNHLKIALRNLLRHKGYSAINIIGLAMGMAACLLILQYVSFELSYDRFHENGKDIYRVVNDRYQNGKLIHHSTMTYSAIGKAMKEDYPDEIAEHVRVFPLWNMIITWNDKKLEEQALAVDHSFLNMFSFPLLAGDRLTALKEPNSIILSETLARKLFELKDDDFQTPVGKTLVLNNDSAPYTITGVCKDVPENSHLQFDFLVSYVSLYIGGNSYWRRADHDFTESNFWHYIQVKPGVDYKALQAKFPTFSQRHFQSNKASGSDETFYLQPLSKAHLYSGFEFEIGKTGNSAVVWGLLIIALFIIIIAWVNYINFATAKSIERAKEVGIRKVAGALRRQLVHQFLTESLLINLAGLLLALVMVDLMQPAFNRLLEHDMSLLFLFETGLNGYSIIGGLTLLVVSGALVSSFYPAVVLSSFRPVAVLKGKLGRSHKNIALRKALVVGQFAITIALIIGSLVVYKQIRFVSNQDLGLNIDQMLVIRPPVLTSWDSTFISRTESYKEAVRQLSHVKGVTSGRVPGDELGRVFDVYRADESMDDHYTFRTWGVNYDFLSVYGMRLLAGRNFTPADHNPDLSKVRSVIVNESAVKLLGFPSVESAVGKKIVVFGRTFDIIGVAADFHQKSLRYPIEPTVLHPNYSENASISIKVTSQDLSQTIAAIRKIHETFFPGNLFDYYFLAEKFNAQYKYDLLFGKVFGWFAGFAIFIACLGLLGLSLFAIAQRTKEVGIRKVMGATVASIVALLSKDFLKLVIIGFVIAVPIAWYAMNRWLQDFAYRIEIGWWEFALAGGTALLIALLTVSAQAIKAALANPVESLRYE
jgi:putative ABC transport system permease protein